MNSKTYFAVITVVAFLILRLAFSLLKQHKRASRARSRGCKSPPAYPQPAWDIFGVKATYDYAKSVKEARVLERIVEQFDLVSRKQQFDVRTMTYHALGRHAIVTKDPENIKAVLATQFEDFKISDVRNTNLGALIGQGIVSPSMLSCTVDTDFMPSVCFEWLSVGSSQSVAAADFHARAYQ